MYFIYANPKQVQGRARRHARVGAMCAVAVLFPAWNLMVPWLANPSELRYQNGSYRQPGWHRFAGFKSAMTHIFFWLADDGGSLSFVIGSLYRS